MAKVQVANVAVLDNPSPFLNPFQFEVTFECIEELKEGNFEFFIRFICNLFLVKFFARFYNSKLVRLLMF